MPRSSRRPRSSRKQMRRRQRRNRQRRSTLPPSISQFSQVYRTTLQTIVEVGTPSATLQSWYQVFQPDKLLTHGRYSAFSAIFSNILVHSITMHYVPYQQEQSAGIYAFVLTQSGFITGSSIKSWTFEGLASSPGSIVRRAHQPAKLTWRPTDPEDKSWISLFGTHDICFACLVPSDKTYLEPFPTVSNPGATIAVPTTIAGRIMVDLSVSFGGNAMGTSSVTDSNEHHYCCAKCEMKYLSSELSAVRREMERIQGASPVPSTSSMELVGPMEK